MPEAHATIPPATELNPQSQADEIQALKARLERYEKDMVPPANDNPLQALFSDQGTIDRMKAAGSPRFRPV